jgi:hypothetical protein
MQTGLGVFTVVTPGTPVQVTTVNVAVPAGMQQYSPRCQAILFQVLASTAPQAGAHTNTGKVYILDRNKVRVATLAVPTANTVPSFSATIPNAASALNANLYWVDADNSGDGVDVSILTP